MDNLIEQAEKARQFFLSNSLDEYDHVLLLPERDEKLNNIMCSAFERKLMVISEANSGRTPKAVVLTRTLPDESTYFDTRTVSDEIIDSLLTLYGMYEFTDKLIIGSFDLPYGRKLRNLLNSEIASETELINTVLFQN